MKQRIITAIIMGIIFIPMALYNHLTAKVLYIFIMLAMAFEYLKNAYLTDSDAFPKLFLGLLGAIGLLFGLYHFKLDQFVIEIIYALVLIFLVLNIILLLATKQVVISKGPYFLLVQLYISLPIILLINELDRNQQLHLTVFAVIILIWLSDIGAYFSGKYLGKRKLFPEISPNKTWEGFFGGGIAVMIGAAIISSTYGLGYSLTQWLTVGVIVWVMGSLGDLVESAYKRNFRIKDSGTMLPGHGGFLDRFDSFIFVIPMVLAYFFFT